MWIKLCLRSIVIFYIPKRYFAINVPSQKLFSFKVPNQACQSCVTSVQKLAKKRFNRARHSGGLSLTYHPMIYCPLSYLTLTLTFFRGKIKNNTYK